MKRVQGIGSQAQRDGSQRQVWLFDLDNTLHDASSAVFDCLRESMTAYIERQLQVSTAEAHLLRLSYWQRYGATLLGLVRHHRVSPAHFLHETHLLPGLEQRLRAPLTDRVALRRLPGQKLLLTNAPRDYALRVLRALGVLNAFHAVISIENMVMFGKLRPKPDKRMFRALIAKLHVPASACTLVEDTLQHQKAAHAVGLKTVWMQRFARQAVSPELRLRQRLARCPAYVGQRVRCLQQLRRL